jgi:hypothetical protein
MYLNLSWNQLLEDSIVTRAVEPPAQDKKKKRRKKKEKDLFLYTTFDDEKDQTDVFTGELSKNATQAIENLCNFIKRNKVLVHADFSHTGLSEKMLWYFGRTLRRSKSIRALHLSGNPGITDRLKAYLSERAHCKVDEGDNIIDMAMLPSHIELRELKVDPNSQES